MQQRLLGLVGKRLGYLVDRAVRTLGDIETEHRRGLLLQHARLRIGLAGIAVDVEGRRVIAVHAEWCHVVELRGVHLAQIGIDFALQGVGAWCRHAVAIRRRRRPADEMVVLVGGDDEQGIVLSDAVLGEAGKKFAECLVECLQLRLVTCFTGAKSAAADNVIVVRVLDIAVDDRHPASSIVAR